MQSAAMLAAARQRPGSGGHDRHATSQALKLLALVAVAAVVVVGVVFAIRLMGDSGPSVGNDAEARKIISANSYQEARGWVTSGNDRFLMGHNPQQSEALIDDLYDLGAKQVLAGGGFSSMRLIIELPEDAEARARLIDWRQAWAERYPQDYPRETDIGQRYLIINMPLNR